jgi:SET domain-containing protein
MAGSVARFINENMTGANNLVVQAVFTPGAARGTCRADNQRLYRIALFAARDIAPMEELCYSYGATYWKTMEGKQVVQV